jgi:hypothetical protein
VNVSRSFRRLRTWVEYSAFYGAPIPLDFVVPKRHWNSRSTRLLGTLKRSVDTCRTLAKWLTSSATNACGMLVLWTVLPATVMTLTTMHPFLRPAPNGING